MNALSLFNGSPQPATVHSIVRAYVRAIEARVLAGTFSLDNCVNTRRSLELFADFAGDREVASLRQFDLTEWLNSRKGWKKKSTRQNAVSAVLNCFRWAEEEQLIDRCPYRMPRAVREESAQPRRPAIDLEYQALCRGGTQCLREALFFLWHTGARTCEMREADLADVRMDPAPHIFLTKHKTVRMTHRGRIIPLDPPTVKLIADIAARPRRTRCTKIFLNNHQGAWDRHTFARHLRRVAKRIGLDDNAGERVTAYCLRHSFTCNLLDNGASEKQVADALGHTDIDMVVKIYGRHMAERPEYLAKIVKKFGAPG